jgi:hypothetical protein
MLSIQWCMQWRPKGTTKLRCTSNFRAVRPPAIVGLYVASIHLCDHQVLLSAIGDLALI